MKLPYRTAYFVGSKKTNQESKS